jgi:outer membrane protein OmpA-like peptidoglycan-associated protein
MKRSTPVGVAVLLAGAALILSSCGGSKVRVAPLLTEFDRTDKEVRALEPSPLAVEALEAGRSKRDAASPLVAKGKDSEAYPIATEAVAEARLALAIARNDAERRRLDDCLRTLERSRQAWENAMITLEQTEHTAGRKATGVDRSAIPGSDGDPHPLPATLLGTDPQSFDPTALDDAWTAWSAVAESKQTSIADLAARFELHRAALADPEADRKMDPHHRAIAGRTVQELESRVRAEAAEQECEQAIRLGERYRESSDAALYATLDLQKQMTEAVEAEARDRQDDMYSALQTLEGKYARITREARGTIVSLADILFDFDKSTLKRDVEFNLVKVSTILNQFPEMQIKVEGHTDNIGREEYNLDLSRRRAQAVNDFLVSQGLVQGRMTVEGYGMSRPVADNATEEGRQRNRRVDLVIQEESVTK